MKKQTEASRAAVVSDSSVTKPYDTIKLGVDWHAKYYVVVRMIDGAGPEPGQKFSPEKFYEWAKKQLDLAQTVCAVSEAGAGGFVMHRRLTGMGIFHYLVHPRKLDPDHKGVVTDRTDAREMVNNLDRYVRGNPKALRVCRVPTEEQEQKRHRSRQRKQLQKQVNILAAQGCSLLLSQGVVQSKSWWKTKNWEVLQEELPSWILSSLETYRGLIEEINLRHNALAQEITKAAQGISLPKGMGAMTFEDLSREVCGWDRFHNRKQPGSYVGLVGGVSSSGNYHADLSITKAGHCRLRAILIQLAWRMVKYQPQSHLLQRWKHVFYNPKATKHGRKKAIVAVARQLFVDLWRWQTGRKTPEQFGWRMTEPTRKATA